MSIGIRTEPARDLICVRGARTHNLCNVDLDIPRNQLVVITGISGSGKSSLAFDTLYAEGQRRYVESLSAYARQFLSVMEKPDVDLIEGLSPAISIEQKSTSHNPRSTVGTITEIYDYLRLLYARAGEPRCPVHGVALSAQTVSQMVDRILEEPAGTRMMLLAPVVDARKGEHAAVIDGLRAQGFVRARIDGEVMELDQEIRLERNRRHNIEAVVDRFRVRDDVAVRLSESLETALKLADDKAWVAWLDEPEHAALKFSARHACPHCGFSVPPLEPRMFSFNNPAGACATCDGLGVQTFFDPGRVVSRPELPLTAGAVRGWDRRNAYYFQMLKSLASHFDFDLETPFEQLPESVRNMVLYGSGEEEVEMTFTSERYSSYTKRQPFEGVIPNMRRRLRETESQVVRDELSKFLGTRHCEDCAGTRLNREARCVFVGDDTLARIAAMPVGVARGYFETLTLTGARGQIAQKILREIKQRLGFLCDVGLDYLALDRAADTLSGGEAQRIRLASQIGAGLVGVMYILDEPSIGLHQRDNKRLLDTLIALKGLGNCVIVVEHDEDAIRAADHVIDMGPGAGRHGGRVVATGTPQEVCDHRDSLTGQFLSGRRRIEVPTTRHLPNDAAWISVCGAHGNNLKHITAKIPLGLMTCVTGVSGSGKSTLINDTLYAAVARTLNGASVEAAPHDEVSGLEHIDRVVDIDQSPIGRTPRSNPATYTGLFSPIRELFAATPEARARGYEAGRFSFNVKGGRCEACAGDGVIKVEMHFLPDIYVECDTCKGKRYNRETLDIRYKGLTIHEVLELTVEDAIEFFAPVPVVKRKLDTMMDVGLGYLQLGQRATTLSGGEAQRIKLSRELSKRDTGRTLYILDEPTTGLHFHDIEQLLTVLHRLRDRGNTVVVIEHNLDVIKTADWIIDLGPEGGDGGGEILVCGDPEHVAAHATSHTGRFLARTLAVTSDKVEHREPAHAIS